MHHHGEIPFPAGIQIFGLICQLSCVVALILVLPCYLYFSKEEFKWKQETGALHYISASVLIYWILTELLWSQILFLAAVATGSEYPVWGIWVSVRRQYSSYGPSHSRTLFPKAGHLGKKQYLKLSCYTEKRRKKKRKIIQKTNFLKQNGQFKSS